MHKLLQFSMALLMSLVLGTGFAISGNPVSAQSYNDKSYDDDDSSYSSDSYTKYSASNYGDSSYSNYPTKDNFYECQKGPLKGIVVGSVEFCDQDLRGPPGKQGPQGDPGPSQILTTSVYSVVGPQTYPTPSVANCETGDTVLSGGFIVEYDTQPIDHEPRISQNTATDNGWTAIGNAGFGDPATVSAVAFCFDNSPPSPP